MRRSTLFLAATSLAVLAGCGGQAAAPPAAGGAADANGAGNPDSNEVKAENEIADCMKKKGFRYVPHPLSFDGGSDQLARYGGVLFVLEPPDQVRTFRAKYGFGAYSKLAYPDDPAVRVDQPDPSKNPNNAIRDALDPAQQQAYDKALEGNTGDSKAGQKAPSNPDSGCAGTAAEKYYGKGPSGDEQAANRREYAAFTNDPAVIKAAQKYGDCLKAKGYQVRRAQPGSIEQEMQTSWVDKVQNAGSISPAEAKAQLDKEIKAALDDLDCSLDYGGLARTKYAKVVRTGGGAG
jgi:hypothetical protein